MTVAADHCTMVSRTRCSCSCDSSSAVVARSDGHAVSSGNPHAMELLSGSGLSTIVFCGRPSESGLERSGGEAC